MSLAEKGPSPLQTRLNAVALLKRVEELGAHTENLGKKIEKGEISLPEPEGILSGTFNRNFALIGRKRNARTSINRLTSSR